MNEITNDLGTLIVPAEMYSNTVSIEKKLNKEMKKNTFQQSTRNSENNGNVDAAAPHPLSPTGASHPGVNEKKNNFGRLLKKNDLIVDMTCSLAKVRTGRHQRINAYFSLKTEHDIRYMIFLRSTLTTAHDEILRSIDKSNNKPLRTIAEDYINQYQETLLLGRIRYKPTNKYVTEQHRTNFQHGLFAIWIENSSFIGELYLNGDYYPFEFDDDLSPEQIKAQYALCAKWELEAKESTGFMEDL